MLKITPSTITAITAVLVKTIEYQKFGKAIVIPSGTLVVVDTSSMIGFYAGEHFNIFLDEFRPSQLN